MPGVPVFRFFLQFVTLDSITRNPWIEYCYLHSRLGEILARDFSYCGGKRNCRQADNCPFCYLYGTKSDNSGLLNDQPHPYILDFIHPLKLSYTQGEIIEGELVLIGKGLKYLPVIARALEQLAIPREGKYLFRLALKGIDFETSLGERFPVYDRIWGLQSPLSYPERIFPAVAPLNSLELFFKTPTLLKSKLNPSQKDTRNHYDPPSQFGLIIRRLLTRTQGLLEAYGEIPCLPAEDARNLIHEADSIQTTSTNFKYHSMERTSASRMVPMNLNGWVGHSSFSGEMTPFLPWLQLGELVRIGSRTAFGFGKYQVITSNGGGFTSI
jgi:hypothetical protein